MQETQNVASSYKNLQWKHCKCYGLCKWTNNVLVQGAKLQCSLKNSCKSKDEAHTHSEMMHARYGTLYAFLFHRCLTTAEKVKKTSRSSHLINTSHHECNHRNNTVTTNSITTVQQPAEYISWHIRHTLLASVSSTMKYTNTPPKNCSSKHRCQFK